MGESELERHGQPEVEDTDLTDRREFLRRFAALSGGTFLLGVSAACCPSVVYGPNPEDVYGPPPDEGPTEDEPEAGSPDEE